MCEFCGHEGLCNVCGEVAGQVAEDYYGRRVRQCREEIAACDARRAAWELRLAELLAASGRRPGDGSDQAALFDVAEPTLF